MKKRIALLAAAVLALTACSSSAGTEVDMKNIDEYTPSETSEEEELSFVTEGETAPDIPIIKLDGTEAKVSDYFDKPTLFVFWATWCSNCVAEMPGVQMLADKYGSDINILALNASDVAEDISEFMEENEYTFEAARVSLEDSLYYYAQSIPITVVTDKDGVVQAYFRGSIDGEQMFSQYFDPLFTDLVEEAKEA